MEGQGTKEGRGGSKRTFFLAALTGILFLSAGCAKPSEKPKPRLVMFVGVDISGSFLKAPHFDDSMEFLSHYLYAHLNGLGKAEVPSALFVGTLGGVKKGEPKSFLPIQVFEGKTPAEIKAKVLELVPKKEDPYSDFNSFINAASDTVRNRKMVLKPVSLVMISDGFVDMPGKGKKHVLDFRAVDLSQLEKLSRNITVRLLYADTEAGKKWENEIRRRRVKVWTQDVVAMSAWREPQVLIPDVPLEKQEKFLKWLKDNVDFGVRMKRVD
jgi:hypothetical protein